MGLDYNFQLSAPAAENASRLEDFLRTLEGEVRALGFTATILNVPFDTDDRRGFARRLARRFWVKDRRLEAHAPSTRESDRYDPIEGACSVVPTRGVVLVTTDEQGLEACFGFLRYPERVHDEAGAIVAETNLNGAWRFQNAIQSPDPRYRRILEMFAAAGYVLEVRDEHSPADVAP